MVKIYSYLILILTMSVLFFNFFKKYDEPKTPKLKKDVYRVMTFNLKYSTSNLLEWNNRKSGISNLINSYRPDSIGLQEAEENWINFLSKELIDYSYIGVGRDDGDKLGEYSAIFYLKDKFNVLDSGNFWLSKTPKKPSFGWDACTKRVATYAILQNKITKEKYFHINTHLDNKGKIAREKSINLLLNKINKIHYLVILTGDLNFFQGSKNYNLLQKSKLKDSKYLAKNRVSRGTINYFSNLYILRYLPPIDFIFVSENLINVNRYEVLYKHRVNKKPLSDHYPIFIDFEFVK